MIHPDDRDAFRTAIEAAIEDVAALRPRLPGRLAPTDRSTGPTAPVGCCATTPDGRSRMLGTGQDITERRRLEEERDQLLIEERRAGEFREAFIDVISHELRTPITTILGLTQILARPGPSRRRCLARRAPGGRARGVRAPPPPRRGPARPEPCRARPPRGRGRAPPAAPAASSASSRTRRRSCRSIQVETELESDLPVVAGEATYVEQIVRNLLGNAAKYTPAGTAVVVDARRNGHGRRDPGHRRRTRASRRRRCERVFELFYRDPDSSRAVAGSGIGLFVCASLVEAMGGRIWAVAAGDRRVGGRVHAARPRSRRRRTRMSEPSGRRCFPSDRTVDRPDPESSQPGARCQRLKPPADGSQERRLRRR